MSSNLCSMRPAQELLEGPLDSDENLRTVGWPGWKTEPGLTCSNSISSSTSKSCCSIQEGVLPASMGDTPSGDPGVIQPQLLTPPKSGYQSAVLSSDHKCHYC